MEALSSDSRRPLSDASYREFQRLVLLHTGIHLADNKRSMIVNRFTRRLNALNIETFEEYIELVSKQNNPETIDFIDTITTNLTYFFREPHHFDFLGKVVLPRLAEGRSRTEPIRIWSAGCSSGQEPYSIGMTVLDTLDIRKQPVKILCTDIHSKLVVTTRVGIYGKEQLRGLDEQTRTKWFKETEDGRWQADIAIRQMMYCKRLNLFGPWPVRSGVDVIMCRNVLIYFNEEYQRRLISGFAAMQTPGSYLFIGHSETLEGFSRLYKRVANTVYERL